MLKFPPENIVAEAHPQLFDRAHFLNPHVAGAYLSHMHVP